jgi:GAF domain-containing protein
MTMVTWAKRILAAPTFEGDEDKTRVAGLLEILLLTTMTAALATVVVAPFVFAHPEVALRVAGLILLMAVISLILMRRGHVRLASGLILFGLWISFSTFMVLSGGVNSIFAMGYVTTTIIAGLLLGGRAAIVVAELSMVAGLGMFYANANGFLPEPVLVTGPGPAWINLTANLVVTVAMLYLATRGLQETLERARRSAAEMGRQRELLEVVVFDRTRDLERQAVQLATAADVGRAAASILDLDTLVRQVVELVQDRFKLYYAGLFLLDKGGASAVLAAGTGEAGRTMRERGHKLEVGGVSMVGAACAQREARIALDVGEEPNRFDNPLLPDTRSEMALPLVVGERVIGALDVQSSEPAAFSKGDIAVLQLVADQVAVAVDNARKFSQEAEVLEATNPFFRVSRRLASAVTTGDIVQTLISSVVETEADGCVVGRLNFVPHGEVDSVTFLGDWNRNKASQFAAGATFPASASPIPLQIVTSYWTINDVTLDLQMPEILRLFLTGYGGRGFINIPLRAAGRVIGFVSIYRAEAGPFSPVSVRLYETLVDQAAVAMERARLLDEAQVRAARERLIAEVSARMREQLDVGAVLKTTADEMYRALDLEEIVIRLTADGSSNS